MAARGQPVTLRDFLELGCDSSSDGFRSYPRCLPCSDDALHLQQQQQLPDLLRRSPSRSPSSLFSRSPSASGALLATRISSLSRSFSRRIFSFSWRRRDDYEQDDLYFVDDRDSCGFPSPLVSSCSASSSDSDSDSDSDLAIHDQMPCPCASQCDKPSSSSSSSSSADRDRTDGGAAADGNKMQADGDPAVGRCKLGMEDKQQLSPVSVLDFPFDDDDADERSDAGTCSPSFHRCPTTPPDDLHCRTTTKPAQLVHKIRRYDGIAQAVDPVDLEAQLTTTSDSGESAGATTHPATSSSSCSDTTTSSSGEEHQKSADPQRPSLVHEQEEPVEYRLLARLLHQEQEADASAAAAGEVSQMLLLDFFAEAEAEGIDERLRCSSAAEWLRGAGLGWGVRDVMLSGKAALEDMERGRRWMCVAEEERHVAQAVEGLLMDGLVDDLVADLLV